MRRRIERLKAQGITDAALARIHAPIGLDIGAVSPPEIAVAIMGEITARLRQSAEKEPRRCWSRRHEIRPGAGRRRRKARIAVHSIRQGGLVLKKGTVIGKAEIAALQAAGIAEIVVARLEPGDVSEDAGRGRDRGRGGRRGRARRPRLHRPRQSVRRERRRAGGRQGRDRPPQPDRRVDHACDACRPTSRWSPAR